MYAQMAESFGPIKTLLGALDPERAAWFRTEILKVFAGMDTGDGRVVFDRPYLLALGARR